MQNQNDMHLNVLERDASIFWREINPKPSSCMQLRRLLDMYATYENWESVINFSSRAVLHLNKNHERAEFYYIWICALNETHDYLSLIDLAKHLAGMGDQYHAYNCLAIIAYHFAGKQKMCLTLLKKQKEYYNIDNKYYREALALFLTSLKNKKHVKKGIVLLNKLCSEKNSGYLTWRNSLRVLSQNNYEAIMSRMYNLMNVRFPFAQEPYMTAALIAINEKNWKESIRLLKQIIKDNPQNKESILALAQSYEENHEIEKAYELMLNNKGFFHDQDYDFNFMMARLHRGVAIAKSNKEDCEEAILYYDKAISLAHFFRFPVSQLKSARDEMQVLNKKLENKNKLLYSLKSFLEKKERLSLASIVSFEGIGQNFKLTSK